MDDPLAHIQSLSEADLRSKILVPLFRKMGFKDVVEHHGSLEFGKDIVFREVDRFAEYVYYGVAVKAVDIHGQVGKDGNASEVLWQAQQVLGEPWVDPFDAQPHRIHRVLIATSGKITQPASLSISKQMEGQPVRFLNGQKIVNLLEEHAPQLLIPREDKGPTPAALWESLQAEADFLNQGCILEQLAKSIFEHMEGFADVVANVRTSREEIDVVVRNESSDPFWAQQGLFIMVECKSRRKTKVGVAELDAFAMKMSRRAGWSRLGFFISLSGFSEEFLTHVARLIHNNLLVVPVDEKDLARVVESSDRKGILKQYVLRTLAL